MQEYEGLIIKHAFCSSKQSDHIRPTHLKYTSQGRLQPTDHRRGKMCLETVFPTLKPTLSLLYNHPNSVVCVSVSLYIGSNQSHARQTLLIPYNNLHDLMMNGAILLQVSKWESCLIQLRLLRIWNLRVPKLYHMQCGNCFKLILVEIKPAESKKTTLLSNRCHAPPAWLLHMHSNKFITPRN